MFYEKELKEIKINEKKLYEKIDSLQDLYFKELEKQNFDFKKQLDNEIVFKDRIKFCNQYKYALGFYELCDDSCPAILINENYIDEAFKDEIEYKCYRPLEELSIDDLFEKDYLNDDVKNIFDYCDNKDSYYNNFFRRKLLNWIYLNKLEELRKQKTRILKNLTFSMNEINCSLKKAVLFLNNAKKELYPKNTKILDLHNKNINKKILIY